MTADNKKMEDLVRCIYAEEIAAKDAEIKCLQEEVKGIEEWAEANGHHDECPTCDAMLYPWQTCDECSKEIKDKEYASPDAVIKRAGDVEGMAEALFGNEMLYSDYDAESRTGPVPKIWGEVSEGDKGYFREIAITVIAWLKEGK